jgi:sugar lactone lactonase YvrE
VLEYQQPFTSGMNASVVIGQPNFASSASATTSTGLEEPEFVAFDSSGNLYVTDSGNNRVLEYEPPFTNGMAASVVLGQTDFVSNGAALTASGLDFPTGITFDNAGDLLLADTQNNRVLEFIPTIANGQFKPTFSNGMNASLVLGQSSFTTGAPATTQSGFNQPNGVAIDGDGNLAVADTGNNRTLTFLTPLAINENANLVLGQPGFTTSTPATTVTGQSSPTSARKLK